ncbi:MAG: hypothetical protein ACYDEY_03155 [Acidimicrobiales bacterium]
MGRKSRMKKERRVAKTRERAEESRARSKQVQLLIKQRNAAARSQALAAVAAADPGPHPLLPARLHARRTQLRDKLAWDAASFWASMGLVAEMLDGERWDRAPDPDCDALHGLDAQVAWEALLAAQDADREAVPDEALCRVVADCVSVDRGEKLDRLFGGTWWVTQDLVDRLVATSEPDGSPEEYAAEFSETVEFVVSRCGEPVRCLLRYLAAEATLHYEYPAGSLPTVEDLAGGIAEQDGALGTWASVAGVPTAEAVALAARVASVLAEISEPGERD